MTSLAEIKSFNPCPSGWKTILAAHPNTPMEQEFPLIDTLKSNSISDVCWLLGKRKKEIDIYVKFAKMCADSVAHLKLAHLNNNYSRLADPDPDADPDDDADADDPADPDDAIQKEKNKQFFIQAILNYQSAS